MKLPFKLKFCLRQPSKPEIRPFSETRRSYSVPTTPNPGPNKIDSPRKPKRTRGKVQKDYFKDRSYMADVYSWARSEEVIIICLRLFVYSVLLF